MGRGEGEGQAAAKGRERAQGGQRYEHEALSFDVPFRSDGFFNATAVAKQFGKRPVDWLRMEETKCYILELCGCLTIEENQLVTTKNGSPERGGGTWLHPKLGVAFARWLDTRFAVWCDMQIDSILRGEAVLINSKSYAEATKIIESVHPILDRQRLSGVTSAQNSADVTILTHYRTLVPREVYKAGLLTENQRVDLFRYFADVHARWLGGEQYPYDLEELVPTVFSHKKGAIRELTDKYTQGVDFRQTPIFEQDETSVSGVRKTDKYHLTCECFEHMVAKRNKAVFAVYSQIFHAARGGYT